MRIKFPALTALCLIVSAHAAIADDAPHSVSDYVNVMEATAARLDTQVTDRQTAGDMAAAQRLVLASAMVRRTGAEFRAAEQASLPEDVGSLPAPIPARLAAAVAMAAAAESRAADDPAFIEDAQRAFNGLLAVLPMKPPHPVFYGVLSGDLAAAPLPADLVIYGYRILDRVLKSPPVVRVLRTEIPALAIRDDRIDVTLPSDIKKAVDFAPPPCESRAGFALSIQDAYAQRRGIWPISWNEEIHSNADLFVLPTPIFYTAKVQTRVEQATEETITVPFEAKSGLMTADCDETRTAEVDVALPEAYKDLNCKGAWIEASGAAKVSGQCVVAGRTLRVMGELIGGKKACSPDKLCACPNSAQGFLEAKGSYSIRAPGETMKIEAKAQPLGFPNDGLAQGRLAVDNHDVLRHVTLSISRRGCPTPVDEIGLNIGDDPEGKAEAVSKTGAFRAVLQKGMLTVGALDAFPTALDRTP